jgi:hypothetical protein
MPGKRKALSLREAALVEASRDSPSEPFAAPYYKLCEDFSYLGATNEEIAARLNVSISTLEQWIVEKPRLRRALDKGREMGLSRVAKSMHRLANGYKHNEDKLLVVNGKVERHRVVKQYPPSVNAATLLLVNRDGKRWKDRKVADASVTLDLGELVREALDRRREREAKVIEGQAVTVAGTKAGTSEDDA